MTLTRPNSDETHRATPARKRALPKLPVFLGCALLAVGLLAQATALADRPEAVIFDWFEYQGRDPQFEAPVPAGHFQNPVLAGFYPDPSVVRVERDYYLVTSSFAYFPGLPVFHSTDLVHWKRIGHALNRRSQVRFENGEGLSRGIFAPTIRYHEGIFYIITTDVDGLGNFYVTATDPAGPWSDPILLPEIKGIDPELFFDDNGRVYIAHNGEPPGTPLYDGHRAIWLWEFDLTTSQVLPGSGRVIVDGGVRPEEQPIWIEAPHLYKVNGWYYLTCAEGGTSTQHSQVILRSRSLDEPFEPWSENPILTQRDLDPARQDPITSTGHADFVTTPAGDWWAVFLGIRPYGEGWHNIGRETFLLPLQWRDGWPQLLPPKTPVPMQPARPQLSPPSDHIAPQTGNFTWRDDFNRPRLSGEWLRLRTAAHTWHRLQPSKGHLRMDALPLALDEKTQPAYLGRRQQHRDFMAATRLRWPQVSGVSAGLVALQSSDFHYFLALTRTNKGRQVFLEKVESGQRTRVASMAFAEPADWLVLGMEQRGAKLHFYLEPENGQRLWVARDVDASLLSTQTAGGFIGATLGIHARRDLPATAPAATAQTSEALTDRPVLASVFADHMLLQRQQPIRVWGSAEPSIPLSLTLGAETQDVTAAADGSWEAVFSPRPAGGPYRLEVHDDHGLRQAVEDILVGDLWLCSGQSNMAFPLSGVSSQYQESFGSLPDLRFASVPAMHSVQPRSQFDAPLGWSRTSDASAQEFSAICGLFGQDLHRSEGIPIGLVDASRSGSVIEAWISAERLRATGMFGDTLDLMALYTRDRQQGMRAFGDRWEAFWRRTWPGPYIPWQHGPQPGHGWQPAPEPMRDWNQFGDPELVDHFGMVWYSRSFDLDPAQAVGSSVIALGGIDEVDVTWINGEFISSRFAWGAAREYEVPEGVLRAGKNQIVLNILSTWDMGGMLGPDEEVQIRLENGDVIPLAGQWEYLRVPANGDMPPRAPWEAIYGLTVQYNAMVAPLRGLHLAGTLWYQGESNAGRAGQYADLLAALVADRREQFGDHLPFIVIQLPAFGSLTATPVESGWAQLRDAQRRVVAAHPDMGLVVTLDTGDRADLHPPNKPAVAQRAADVARALAYGHEGPTTGAVPRTAKRHGDRIVLEFEPASTRLRVISSNRPAAFELCGDEPGTCTWADAQLKDNRIILSGPGVAGATRVRHCWADAPICNLWTERQLPVSTFESRVKAPLGDSD